MQIVMGRSRLTMVECRYESICNFTDPKQALCVGPMVRAFGLQSRVPGSAPGGCRNLICANAFPGPLGVAQINVTECYPHFDV